MSDYLTKTEVNNMKELTASSINCLVWELKSEFEIELNDRGELNFDLSYILM